jgi:hypothetical protein
MRHLLRSCLLLLSLALPASAAEVSGRDAQVDRAVERGLENLFVLQDKNEGCWRGGFQETPAVTGLAVMAFLSAGHVPGEGRYGATVENGIRWILRNQKPNGLIAANGSHEMYHHGIATLMLAEVTGMTDSEMGKETRAALEKAVAIILRAQRTRGMDRGGWRYRVDATDSDMSVTGWQVMALRAAKNVGCDVPAEAIEKAVEYIKRCQDRSGGFRYNPYGGGVTVACTGTSILSLEICGKAHHHCPEALRGGAFLIRTENLPQRRQQWFYYSTYYGTQAAFQLGGNYWNVYRPHLHDALLNLQNGSGFWEGGPGDGGVGRSYCTAMAILALTVEYRFLPIYQRGEEPADVAER